MENDSVQWCTDNFPKLYSCKSVDDKATANPVLLSQCTKNEQCKANGKPGEGPLRDDLGSQAFYFETVTKANGTQGCWAYDEDREHAPYMIEVMCCK